MSTQPLQAPHDNYDSQFCLILGPPGGGKGTISKKMLAVRERQTVTHDVLARFVRSLIHSFDTYVCIYVL
jgi:ABC-type Mn2+/Zn2+ transport system ATPase subunit